MRVKKSTIRELAAFYFRNGYVRWQNPDRVDADGYRKYKKGDEVRLMAKTKTELRTLKKLLKEAGFQPGKPFDKGLQICLPIYGYDQVDRFLDLVESVA